MSKNTPNSRWSVRRVQGKKKKSSVAPAHIHHLNGDRSRKKEAASAWGGEMFQTSEFLWNLERWDKVWQSYFGFVDNPPFQADTPTVQRDTAVTMPNVKGPN